VVEIVAIDDIIDGDFTSALHGKSAISEVGYIDVRDATLTMITGINTPGKTRNLLIGEWFELKDAVGYVGTLHPELRIPTLPLSGQVDSMR
jgi:hypothetical protein